MLVKQPEDLSKATQIQCVSKVPPEQWSKLELAMYRECVGNAGMNSKLMTSVVDWLE